MFKYIKLNLLIITLVCALSPIGAMNIYVGDDFDPKPYNLLEDAIRQGNNKAVMRLINNEDRTSSYFLQHAINYSIELDKIELFKWLYSQYPQASEVIKETNALYNATHTGNLSTVKLVIEKGVDLDGSMFKRPLIKAAQKGFSGIIQYLIEQGADVRMKQLSSNTALYEALKAGHTDTAETILTAIPQQEIRNLENTRHGIIAGLIAVRRGAPSMPKDIRKAIARMIIAPLAEYHMKAYAQEYLNDVRNSFNLLEKFNSWQALTTKANANIHRILFSKPALDWPIPVGIEQKEAVQESE